MIDYKGNKQTSYMVQDKKTGKTYVTYESYAKKLEKSGTMKVVSKEGDKGFNKVKNGEGK